MKWSVASDQDSDFGMTIASGFDWRVWRDVIAHDGEDWRCRGRMSGTLQRNTKTRKLSGS